MTTVAYFFFFQGSAPSGAMNGRTMLATSGRAAQSGTAALTGKTLTTVTGRGSLAASFAALTGRTLVAVRGAAGLVASGNLFGRTITGVRGGGSLTSHASLFGRLFSATFGQGALLPFVVTLTPTLVAVRTKSGQQVRDLPAFDATEQATTIALDFGQFLPPGVTLQGTPTVEITVHTGTDADPQSRSLVTPQIGLAPLTIGGSGVASSSILFQLGDCVGGTTYLIWGWCRTTSGDVASLWTHAAVVTPS